MELELYSVKKIRNIIISFLIFVLVIVLRLFYLQIHQGDAFLSRGERNFLRVEVLDSPRGNVLDCNGKLLATNRPVFDIYWEGSGKRKLSLLQQNIIDKVFGIIGEDDEKGRTRIKVAEKFSRRVKVSEDISFGQLCQISEQCSSSSNLVIVNSFKRVYPYGTLASHILGYLGRESHLKTIGRYGLEKVFQEDLEGKKGYTTHVTNSTGRRLGQKEQKQAQAGMDIKLTIDRNLQLIAESLFEDGRSGIFLVMDPENGDIKALVSQPNFDPNLFLEPISEQEWSDLSARKSPFLNRVTKALYPPASIFKLITFAAGVEEGIITPGTEFECEGYTSFCNRKYHCIRRYGHGVLSCRDALAFSCNIPCFEIAKSIDIDQLAKYAHYFGLGSKTDFIMDDKSGLVPTREWKQIVKGEGWWRGETFSVSIGQSFLLVTPLQIARMIGAICTGYLIRPRILLDESVEKTTLNIKQSTLDFLREAMELAREFGTAKRLKSLKDFSIHAKTGTAQTASLEAAQLEHGWFTAYFSYKDEKPLVLISLVERAGRSLPPLLMAKKFLLSYAALLKKEGS